MFETNISGVARRHGGSAADGKPSRRHRTHISRPPAGRRAEKPCVKFAIKLLSAHLGMFRDVEKPRPPQGNGEEDEVSLGTVLLAPIPAFCWQNRSAMVKLVSQQCPRPPFESSDLKLGTCRAS